LSVFFATSLVVGDTDHEELDAVLLVTRYVDPFIPILMAATFMYFNKDKFGKKVFVRFIVCLLFLVSLFEMFFESDQLKAIDPVRSPLIYALQSKFGVVQENFLILFLFFALVTLIIIRSNVKLFFLANLIVYLVLAPPLLGWNSGFELLKSSGHELVVRSNNYLDLNQQESNRNCIQIEVTKQENWWSLFNYSFWSKYPVQNSNFASSCKILITDDFRYNLYILAQGEDNESFRAYLRNS
jgi:hypothetical protein